MLTRLRSLLDRLAYLAREEWLYATALVGGVLTILPLLPGWPRWASVTLAAAGAFLALVLLVRDTRAISRRFGSWILSLLEPVFECNPQSAELKAVPHARGTIYRSDAVDDLLRSSNEITVRLVDEAYVLPRELREIAPYILTRTTATKRPFNGQSLRLMTDPRAQEPLGDLSFQPVSYFDFLCSNELMKWRLLHHGVEYNFAQDFMLDTHGRLLTLAESLLANIVGVSTLAVTDDGFALLVQQTQSNSASGGLLAPSGSGSLEHSDARPRDALSALVAAGATREMREETGVPRSRIGRTELTGFGRWLERGSKPEFFAVTRLKGDLAEVKLELERLRRAEHLYTGGVEWCPMEVLMDATRMSVGVSPEAKRIRSLASLPLHFCAVALSRVRPAESRARPFGEDG